MTIWHAQRATKTVLSVALLLSGMAFAALPVGAATIAARAVNPVCGPKTVTSQPSPGVGKEATYAVDGAGTVTMFQESTTMLKITDADANASWNASVRTLAGVRVHVGFQQVGQPQEQERFWARLNTLGTPGTDVNIVLQSCS
jgi:hypothetical protein